MKKAFVLAASAFILALSAPSFAQFGNIGGALGNLTGAKSGSNAGADVGGQQDQLVRSYVSAGKEVLTANGQIASALGIKAQAVNAAATSDTLSASEIEAQDKAISADSASISEALKSGASLKDAEAKAKYSQGLISLTKGVKKYVDMGKDAKGFATGMAGVSPLQLGKLQSGMYIVQNLPGSVGNLSGVLKSAIDFARTNGVEVPKDATSLL
jgi:hypothetical protein